MGSLEEWRKGKDVWEDNGHVRLYKKGEAIMHGTNRITSAGVLLLYDVWDVQRHYIFVGIHNSSK
jgi:hypothetical protein